MTEKLSSTRTSSVPKRRAPSALPPRETPSRASYAPDALSLAGSAGRWRFDARRFPGFYDASGDRASAYDFPAILKDLPAIWRRPYASDLKGSLGASVRPGETYGELFKRIGNEMGVDPFALAAYCVFESYNSAMHSFNPRMKDESGAMVAAGMGATQAQDWKGKLIPGLGEAFPKATGATAKLLRANPEYALRCLAAEFKAGYQVKKDLAKAFPHVAFPAWKNPHKPMGNYGTQAQYVSRAYALYKGFLAADSEPALASGSRG